nr:hypothetical protein [Tanacetum cinerariifolium]
MAAPTADATLTHSFISTSPATTSDTTPSSPPPHHRSLHHHATLVTTANPPSGPYALSWKPCQGDSLNLPDQSLVPAKLNSYYQAFNIKSLSEEIEMVKMIVGCLNLILGLRRERGREKRRGKGRGGRGKGEGEIGRERKREREGAREGGKGASTFDTKISCTQINTQSEWIHVVLEINSWGIFAMLMVGS